MNTDLILMIILVVALLFGNLWLLKRNNKSFNAKRRPSPTVSQTKKSNPTTDATAVDSTKPNNTQNHQQHNDQSADDGGGSD